MTLLGSANSTLDGESGSSTTSGTTLAEGMEAPVSKMPDSIEAHCQASLKSAKDRDRGPYTASASEKSLNEASGKTGSEKKFYHNVSSGTDFAAQPFCVAEYVEHRTCRRAVTVWTLSRQSRLERVFKQTDSGTQTGSPDPESSENIGGATCANHRQSGG